MAEEVLCTICGTPKRSGWLRCANCGGNTFIRMGQQGIDVVSFRPGLLKQLESLAPGFLSQSLDAILKEGDTLLDSGQNDEALKRFQNALELAKQLEDNQGIKTARNKIKQLEALIRNMRAQKVREEVSKTSTDFVISGARFTKYWMLLVLFPDFYNDLVGLGWGFTLYFRFGYTLHLFPHFSSDFWLFEHPSWILFAGGSSIANILYLVAILILFVASINYRIAPLKTEVGLQPILWTAMVIIIAKDLIELDSSEGDYISISRWAFLFFLFLAILRPTPRIGIPARLSQLASTPNWGKPRFSFEITESNPVTAYRMVRAAAFHATIKGVRVPMRILTESPPDFFTYRTSSVSGRKLGSQAAPATQGAIMLGPGIRGTLISGIADRPPFDDSDLFAFGFVFVLFTLVAGYVAFEGASSFFEFINNLLPGLFLAFLFTFFLGFIPHWVFTSTGGKKNIGWNLCKILKGTDYRQR